MVVLNCIVSGLCLYTLWPILILAIKIVKTVYPATRFDLTEKYFVLYNLKSSVSRFRGKNIYVAQRQHGAGSN
jgi:hypothetical protein